VRDRRTWISYAQLAIFGYFIYGFGPVVPLLRDEQHTSRTVASLHGTTFAIGAAVGGFVLPYLVRRLGRRTVIWVGLVGVAATTAGFCVSHALPATLAWAFVGSMFGGFAVNGIVATLSELHGPGGSAAISEANAGAAAVGVVAPLVIGAAVTAGFGWRPGLAVVVAAVVLVAGAALLFPVPPAARPTVVAGPARGKLPVTYWLAWLSMVATGSVEVCLNLWVGDVLRTHAQVSPGGAAAAVSAIIAGMTVGRLIGGRLVLRLPAPTVILGALALSAVGFTVFWLATAPWLAIVGLVLTGLGNALHYPLGVALAVEYSGGRPDLAAARSSYAMAVSFGVAPFVLGAVADGVGPHLAFLLVPVLLAASAVAIVALRRRVAVLVPAADLEAA
jgi:MFS family permease